MTPAGPALLLAGLATLLITAGGGALVVQAKNAARSLLLAGFGAAVAAGLAARLLAATPHLGMLDALAAVAAVAGLVALIVRRFWLGCALVVLALIRFALWPLIGPVAAPFGLVVVLVVAPFVLFILIWILQRILTPFFGEGAAGHVTGEYLVRALDATGRLLAWICLLPFRLLLRGGRRPEA